MDISSVNTSQARFTQNPLDMETRRDMDSAPDPKSFFKAFLEVVNPLQHLPVISNIYRYLSGDTIHPITRILGDGLYGGFVGLASGFVNATVEAISGKDIGGNILAMVFGESDTAPKSDSLPSTEVATVVDPASLLVPQPHPKPVIQAAPAPTPSGGSTEKIEISPLQALPSSEQMPALPRTPVDTVAGDRRFLPFGGARIYPVPPRADLPHPPLIRSKDGARTSTIAPPPGDLGAASTAYGRALELSRQIRDHYQPQNSGSIDKSE